MLLLFASSSTSGGRGGNSGGNNRWAGIFVLGPPGDGIDDAMEPAEAGDRGGGGRAVVTFDDDVGDVGVNGGEVIVAVFICLR